MSDKPTPNFPGVLRPSVDFGPILTELRTTPLQLTVDLSTARSGATALVLPITGNVLYIDNRPGTGTAELVLIDDTMTPGPARITVGPGYVLRAPFRAIAVENSAQAGQSLRIIYGVDIEFAPGQAANVTLSGTPNFNIASIGGVALGSQPAFWGMPTVDNLTWSLPPSNSSSSTALGAGATEQVFAAGANTGGCIVRAAQFISNANAGTDLRQMSLIAKATAPTGLADGIVVLMATHQSANTVSMGQLNNEFRLPANVGLFWYAVSAETQALRSVSYNLL